jgi:hypothetical protein
MSKTRVYKQWQGLKIRCYTKTHPSYKHYGAKGVRIYKPWINDFQAFYAYMGEPPAPHHTIGRYDLAGDFCPENVFWMPIEDRKLLRRKKYDKKDDKRGDDGHLL